MEYKDKIKNVAIYLRKSRNNEGEETEETLQKHKQRLLEIATKNNWKYQLFQEVGSSMNENRPEYSRMLEALKEGLFDAVLSVNLARVTRDDAEAPKFMNLIRNEDILFVTDSEKIYDLENQDDWKILKFHGFMDNMEYENIKAQLRKGKKDSAKLGKWSNGTPNYGYVYNKLEKKLEIDEQKAKVVRLAYQWVIDGMGVDNVAIELNKLGYRTNKGKYFHGHTIKRMIEAEIYKGWIVSNKIKGRNKTEGKLRPEDEWIIVKDAHEPIIDEDTWDKANESLEARKQLSPRAKQRRHGLSGIIKCANCGKAHAVSNRKDRGNVKVLQPCKKKNSLGVTCKNKGYNYYKMLELIINEVKEHKEQVKSYLSDYKEDNGVIDAKDEKLNQLEAQINKVKKALKMLQIQLEEELIDIPGFKERKRERMEQLNQLEEEYNKLADTTKEDEINALQNYTSRLEVFLNEWDKLDDEKLNLGLRTFIDKAVWQYPKNAENPQLNIVWKAN
ncbi:recombinase family protein [Piscibacillus sp. B03]|uniref:recombinase family protein n=1 Tax=Piscibacillus sp. B03 TaxID=3457430 RepID=UPI003FCD4544